jgi:rhodanese-related sulfurtransferase
MAVVYLLVIVLSVLALAFMVRLMGRVNPTEAKRLVERGAMLVDLQGRQAFNNSHLPRARNIPLVELPRRLKELGSRDRPVVIYGVGQATNGDAARILRTAGFRYVHDLGPMSRWE